MKGLSSALVRVEDLQSFTGRKSKREKKAPREEGEDIGLGEDSSGHEDDGEVRLTSPFGIFRVTQDGESKLVEFFQTGKKPSRVTPRELWVLACLAGEESVLGGPMNERDVTAVLGRLIQKGYVVTV